MMTPGWDRGGRGTTFTTASGQPMTFALEPVRVIRAAR